MTRLNWRKAVARICGVVVAGLVLSYLTAVASFGPNGSSDRGDLPFGLILLFVIAALVIAGVIVRIVYRLLGGGKR